MVQIKIVQIFYPVSKKRMASCMPGLAQVKPVTIKINVANESGINNTAVRPHKYNW